MSKNNLLIFTNKFVVNIRWKPSKHQTKKITLTYNINNKNNDKQQQ